MTGTDRRRQALDEIAACVCRDRQNMYGDAEDNFRNIADLLNVVLQDKLADPLDSLDVAKMMLCVKLGRMVTSPRALDHWIDAGGYAVCGAGIVKSEQTAGLVNAMEPA